MATTQTVSGTSVERTSRTFWLFVLCHVALWTLLPILFHPNAPLDVVEQVTWGREWQLGYYKHPPLAAWLTNAAYLVSGGNLWSLFLLSQAAIAVCFWAVWKLAQEVVDESRALAAVLLLEGVLYFSFTSAEFNPNVLELPMWGLIAFLGWRALNRGRTLDWILLGIFAGLGLWTKYYTGILLLAVLLFFISDREARRVFRTAGPYLTFVITTAVFAPHLIWMVSHRFATITYAVARAEGKKTLATHFAYPISFIGSQLLAVALMLVTFIVLFGVWRKRPDWPNSLANRYLASLALGPLALTLILSLLFSWKLRSMWGTPLWSLLPLLMLSTTDLKQSFVSQTRLIRATAVVALILAQAFVLPLTVGPRIYKPRKALYPGDAMGKVVTGEWRRQTKKPLFYVVGDTWMAGNMAFYSPDHPSVLTDADPHLSPWIDMRALRRYGAVIVWEGSNYLPEDYRAQFPDALVQSAIQLPYHTRANVSPAVIHWAIVPPRERPTETSEPARESFRGEGGSPGL